MGTMTAGRRSLLSAIVAAAMALVIALPVFAYQDDSGSINCGSFIAYVHSRFNKDVLVVPPGSSEGHLHVYAPPAAWHTREDNGSYYGSWFARGYDYLDAGATYAGCRNYGK